MAADTSVNVVSCCFVAWLPSITAGNRCCRHEEDAKRRCNTNGNCLWMTRQHRQLHLGGIHSYKANDGVTDHGHHSLLVTAHCCTNTYRYCVSFEREKGIFGPGSSEPKRFRSKKVLMMKRHTFFWFPYVDGTAIQHDSAMLQTSSWVYNIKHRDRCSRKLLRLHSRRSCVLLSR